MTVQIAARIALVAVQAVTFGCFVDFEPGETVFACTEGSCPGTHECVSDVCVPRAEDGTPGSAELIAEYLFNVSLDDSSGNGHHAEAVAPDGSITYTDGVEGGASLSIGTDNEARVSFEPLTMESMTLEAWVRPATNQDGSGFLWSTAFSVTVEGNGEVSCAIAANQILYANGGTALAGEWTHIACSYDISQGVVLYVNGEQLASTASVGPLRSIDSGVWIGETVVNDVFEGEIDVLRIWDGLRSQDEITESANIQGE